MFTEELGGAALAWARLLWAAVDIWHLFYLVWTSLVSLWSQFSLLLLCYPSFLRAASFLPAQVPVANESQSVVQQPFQQPVLVPASQSVQGGLQAGGVPIYYSVIPTAQQNGTR